MRWFVSAVFIICFLPSGVSSGQEFRTRAVASGPSQALNLDLTGVSALDGAAITIRNSGANAISFPQVSNPGSLWPYSTAAILKQLPPTTTDQQFAIASWQYVMNHNFHYCSAGSRTETGMTYTYDPVQLLNGYGYGCCDQLTRTLIWIWVAAGYQGRMVELPFHVVPEIFYGGAWHMYDPDHRVYYVQDDGLTVASVADIVAEPSLVNRASDAEGMDPVGFSAAWMAQQYAESAQSLEYFSKPQDIFRTLGIPVTLHAHEELTIHSENSMPSPQFYDYGDPFLPQNVSYGEFNWDLSFGDPVWRSRANSTINVDIFPDSFGNKYVKHVSGDPGFLIYRESSVFPVLALSVSAEVGPERPLLYAYFSTDGSHWSVPVQFQVAKGISSYQLVADLTPFAKGSYTYYVNVQVNSGQLHKLRISPVVQISKHLFPTLQAGAPNQLFYTDSSTYAGRAVRVSAQVPAGDPPIRGVQAESLVSENSVYSLGRDYGAANLVDGDPDSLAYPASNHLDYLIHLGGPHRVSGMSIDWGRFGTDPKYLKTWSVLGRNGDQIWQLLASGGSPANELINLSFTSTTATDLRIIGDGFNNIGIFEAQVFGTEFPVVPRSALTVVSNITEDPKISLAAGYKAGNLIDGKTDTLAYPGATKIDYQISIASPTHISSAIITWGIFGTNPSYTNSWSLLGRNGSDQPWLVLAQGGFPNAASVSVSLDATVSDLRLVASARSFTGVYEIQLYGYSDTPLRLQGITAYSNLKDSSMASGFSPASGLVDGDENTLTYPGTLHLDDTLDPGQNAYIDSVQAVWGIYGTDPRYVTSWRLLGQREGATTWEVVARGGYPNAISTAVSVRNSYRKLRIAAEGDFDDIGIYEMQIFGLR